MKLSTWAEVAGILALVVSLVFVGIEIRNNTAATSAQALLELNVAMNDIMLLQADNAELADIVRMGDSDIDSLSPTERYRYMRTIYSVLNNHENAFMFHTKGVLDANTYAIYGKGTCGSLSQPGVQKLWKSGELFFQERFNEYLKKTCSGLGDR